MGAATPPEPAIVTIVNAGYYVRLAFDDPTGDAALDLFDLLAKHFAEHAPFGGCIINLTGGPFSFHTKSFMHPSAGPGTPAHGDGDLNG